MTTTNKKVKIESVELTAEELESKAISEKVEQFKKKHRCKVIYFSVIDNFDGEKFDYYVRRPSNVEMDAYTKDAKDSEDVATKNLIQQILLEGDRTLLKGDDWVMYTALVDAVKEILTQSEYKIVKM